MEYLVTILLVLTDRDGSSQIHDAFRTVENLAYPKERIALFVDMSQFSGEIRPTVAKIENYYSNLYSKIVVSTQNLAELAIDFAKGKNSAFFYIDDVIVIRPDTLKWLGSLNLEVVSPMLRHDGVYSNFHAAVDDRGFYKEAEEYWRIINRSHRGIFSVPVVNGCYLVRHDTLKFVRYADQSSRPPYVIFSEALRQAGIPQYIDNRHDYGVIRGRASSGDLRFPISHFLNLQVSRPARVYNNPKIGVLTDIAWLKSYIANEHYHLVRLLNKLFGYHILDVRALDFKSQAALSDLDTYDLLLICYQREVRIPVDRLESYVVFKIDDLVSYDKEYDNLLRFYVENADMVISPYAYTVREFWEHENVVWVPYSASVEEVGDVTQLAFNALADPKVFVSGSRALDRPLREYMWHLETEDVVRLDHPGYGKKYGSEDIVGARYYEELRKWLCGFCDGHTFRYLHPKNFEIASVGSLLLADRIIEGPMNELGFVDQETCIFCDREDAKEKVEWIVDDRNRSEVDRIRAAGMGLVWGKHLTRHRAGDIDKIFRSALGVWS